MTDNKPRPTPSPQHGRNQDRAFVHSLWGERDVRVARRRGAPGRAPHVVSKLTTRPNLRVFSGPDVAKKCFTHRFGLTRACPFRKFDPAWDSHRRTESSHDWGRCLQSYTRSECSWSICSSPGAGCKPRTCFSAINSALP